MTILETKAIFEDYGTIYVNDGVTNYIPTLEEAHAIMDANAEVRVEAAERITTELSEKTKNFVGSRISKCHNEFCPTEIERKRIKDEMDRIWFRFYNANLVGRIDNKKDGSFKLTYLVDPVKELRGKSGRYKDIHGKWTSISKVFNMAWKSRNAGRGFTNDYHDEVAEMKLAGAIQWKEYKDLRDELYNIHVGSPVEVVNAEGDLESTCPHCGSTNLSFNAVHTHKSCMLNTDDAEDVYVLSDGFYFAYDSSILNEDPILPEMPCATYADSARYLEDCKAYNERVEAHRKDNWMSKSWAENTTKKCRADIKMWMKAQLAGLDIDMQPTSTKLYDIEEEETSTPRVYGRKKN